MTISVHVFASLSEQLNLSSAQHPYRQGLSVMSVWNELTDNRPVAGVNVAVNQSYSSFEAVLSDGDELAFFPPVTGG